MRFVEPTHAEYAMREWTGRCSKFFRGRSFCNLPIGHEGECRRTPRPKRLVCRICGDFTFDLAAHRCGTEACQ